MKRIFRILRAGVLLAFLLNIIPAMAAATEQPETVQLTIDTDDTTVEQGRRVLLKLR